MTITRIPDVRRERMHQLGQATLGEPAECVELESGIEIVVAQDDRSPMPFVVRGPFLGMPIAAFTVAQDAIDWAERLAS